MSSKFATIFLFWALSSVTAIASGRAPLIISDVDDTVKHANVPDVVSAAVDGLFGERIFPGMVELYKIMAREPDSLIFLSGGPTLLSHHVHEELDEAGFPAYRLFLRDIFKSGNSVPIHKRDRLEELASANPETPFLLIGDDGEQDPEILSQFARSYPGKATRIYIHRVLGRTIPSGITSYYTAFEIALSEVKAGRISPAEAAEVGEAVVTARRKFVFPKYIECPKEIAYPDSAEISASPVLQSLIAKNRARWSAYCASSR